MKYSLYMLFFVFLVCSERGGDKLFPVLFMEGMTKDHLKGLPYISHLVKI